MADLSHLSAVGFATLAALFICSVMVVAIVWDRLKTVRQTVIDTQWLHAQVHHLLLAHPVARALDFVAQLSGPAARLYACGLQRHHLSSEALEVALEQTIEAERRQLEQGLTAVGTVAVIAPFIGLFGTVVGIMNTFGDVAQEGQAGVAVVSAGVSEALVATAAGLVVAIAAVVFFNYLKGVISGVVGDLGLAAQRLTEMLELKKGELDFPPDLKLEKVSVEAAETFLKG